MAMASRISALACCGLLTSQCLGGVVILHVQAFTHAGDGAQHIDRWGDQSDQFVLGGANSGANLRLTADAEARVPNGAATATVHSWAERGLIGALATTYLQTDLRSSTPAPDRRYGNGTGAAQARVRADVTLTAPDGFAAFPDVVVYTPQLRIDGLFSATASGEGLPLHDDVLNYAASFKLTVNGEQRSWSLGGGNRTESYGSYIDDPIEPYFILDGFSLGDTVTVEMELNVSAWGTLYADYAEGLADCNFHNTMAWMGGSFFDEQGNELAGYSLMDDGGYDWMLPVPGPCSGLVLLSGLLSGAQRRRQVPASCRLRS
ncbi:MAG: hypothetical protein H6810_00435 [Phycisphaeraceae bacterium]|nr:MAG: hypothetical protein H6810_00435 [Phycisphaeraceae bacterium]